MEKEDYVKCLCIGDTHHKENNVDEQIEMAKSIYNLLDSRDDIDFIVSLGDNLDSHEKMYSIPFTILMKFLGNLSDRLPLLISSGNHDQLNGKTFLSDYGPYIACKRWKNTYVADDNIVNFSIKGYNFITSPYVPPGMLHEALTNEKDKIWTDNNISCVFAHQEMKGCFYGFKESEVGDEWPDNNCPLVSGHIHEHGILGEKSGNTNSYGKILYVGTPFLHSFTGDEDHTVSIMTFYKDEETMKKYTKKDTDISNKKLDILVEKIEEADNKEEITKLNIELKSLKKKLKRIKKFNNYFDNYLYSEERIDLGLTQRKIFKIDHTEVDDYVIPKYKENIKIKLEIQGPNSIKNVILKSENVKKWEKRNIKIVYKSKVSKDDSGILLKIKRNKKKVPSFREEVAKRVTGDKDLEEAHRDAFIEENDMS